MASELTVGKTLADGGAAATPAYSFGHTTATGMYSPGANQIRFSTASTDRLTIDSAGLATFSNGIAFQSATTGSGTGTGYTLDSYEEGTFTPTWVSTDATFSYAIQSGRYTRIGNKVSFHIYTTATASGTLTNPLSLTGLPFASRSGTNSYHMTSTWGSQVSTTIGSWGFVEPGQTVITSRASSAAAATPAFYSMNGGYWITLSGTYYTS